MELPGHERRETGSRESSETKARRSPLRNLQRKARVNLAARLTGLGRRRFLSDAGRLGMAGAGMVIGGNAARSVREHSRPFGDPSLTASGGTDTDGPVPERRAARCRTISVRAPHGDGCHPPDRLPVHCWSSTRAWSAAENVRRAGHFAGSGQRATTSGGQAAYLQVPLMSNCFSEEVFKERLGKILSELVKYTEVHFKAEEGMLQANQYPGLMNQKAEHQRFTTHDPGFSGEIRAERTGIDDRADGVLEGLARQTHSERRQGIRAILTCQRGALGLIAGRRRRPRPLSFFPGGAAKGLAADV